MIYTCEKDHTRIKGNIHNKKKCVYCEMADLQEQLRQVKKENKQLIKANINLVDELNLLTIKAGA